MHEETKEERIINAKIQTKANQINNIGHAGPFILIAVGIMLIIFGVMLIDISVIVIALIVCGIAYWWDTSRENERRKLRDEIRELKAELEPEK